MKKGDIAIFDDYYYGDVTTGIVLTTGRGKLEGHYEVLAAGRSTGIPHTFWAYREDLMSIDEWEEWGREEYELSIEAVQ